MIHSVYQLAIFDFVANGNGSAIIGAVAGSGKTTSIIEACRRIPAGATVLFLAFNVSIVTELKARLPSNVACSTFNSCGWGAWRRFTGKKMITIDAKKTWKIIDDKFSDDNRFLYGAFVAKMVALAKSSGLRSNDPIEKWMDLQDHHAVLIDSKASGEEPDYDLAFELCRKTLEASIQAAKTVCDFDDQIYMPWLMNASFDLYDFVFVDECQDISGVQGELLGRMLKKGGRLIAVGDSKQAIYGFRGADSNSFDKLKITFSATELPLSISYRCARAIVMEAQAYVSHIESFENAPEGQVEHLDNYDINSFTQDDAILCRNNAPLIEMAYAFISRSRGVNFLGRDIGGGLKSLIRNMEAKSLTELSTKLQAWLSRESVKLVAKRQEEKIELLQDRVNCIDIFIEHLPESRQTVADLLNAIDNLFESKGSGITLSSVHKSKGKEWSRVFILDFHLMPSSYAKKKAWMMEQENNLIYVAITRAQHYLGYINSKCWTDSPNLILTEKKSAPKAVESKPSKSKPSDGKMSGFNSF